MHIDVSNDVGGDIDRVETSEWLEALDAVVVHDGADRARDLLARVVERAQHAGTGPIGSLNTPYVNTIPLEREAQLPGDPAVERRIARQLRLPFERDRVDVRGVQAPDRPGAGVL